MTAPRLRAASCLLFLAVSGCALARQETNEPLDPTVVRSLQPGVTTARDVVERMGAPNEVVQLGRRTAYRYDATTTKSAALFLLVFNMAGQDTRSDRLWVFFDENNVLTHHGSTFGTHRAQYALPWEDVHEHADNTSRDAARQGLDGASGAR